MDHQWLLPSFTCEKTLCRAVPVAHPGCPMDHFQTHVNRSPGDLWERYIGTITIGAGNIEHFGRDSQRDTPPRDTIRVYGGKKPLPASHEGSPGENSPSSYTTSPPMTTRRGKTAGSPSNGVQPHLLWRWSGSTGVYSFGTRRNPLAFLVKIQPRGSPAGQRGSPTSSGSRPAG